MVVGLASYSLTYEDFFMLKTKAVYLSNIRIDGGTQQRCEINNEIVEEYAEAMRCGTRFPPVVLFFDGAVYWLADGFHRYHASKKAEMLDILGEIHEGINRDAVLYSTGANGTHGIRLTNDDKRKAVKIMLADKEWSKWPDNQIAKHCKVTQPFVSKLRNPAKTTQPKGVITVITTPPQPAPVANLQNHKPEEPQEHDGAPSEEEYSEIDALRDQVSELQNIVAAGFAGTTDEDRASGLKLIADLRHEIKTLTATLDAVTISRDTFQRENAQMKKQMATQRKEIEKLKGGKKC